MIEIDLDEVVKTIKARFSSTGVMSKEVAELKDFVSTGNLAFDLISDGGIPFGVGTEFIGLSSSGKSVFSQMVLANAQKKYNAIGVLADREKSWFNNRLEELNIDTSKIIRAPPRDISEVTDAFEFVIDTIQSVRRQSQDQYIVAIIDSIGAFAKDVDLDKQDPGRIAQFIKAGMRKLMEHIDDRVMSIIVNHIYYAVGVMYGSPLRQGGGEGLKYFNTVRIALEDKKKIKDSSKGDEVVGSWLGVEVIKTRLGPCFRNCFVPHYYETGVPYYGGYLRLLAQRGYVKPKNKQEFFSFNQSTCKYKDSTINEKNIEAALAKYPELLFTIYPDFNTGDTHEHSEEMD